jgi:hypothetical protein
VPSGKYVVIIDQYGQTMMLARPNTQSLLIFDGDDTYFADGSDQKPINLNSLKKLSSVGVLNGLLAQNAAGRMFNLVNETSAKMALKSVGGQVFFESDGSTPGSSGGGLPSTGQGILIKVGNNDPVWLSDAGLIYITPAGQPIAIPSGIGGTILSLDQTGGTPTWKQPPNGSIASGSGALDLSGVVGGSLSLSQVNLKIPTFGLTNGADSITLTGVNVTVNLTNPVGLLGLDTGGESSDKWYYIYIISDGTATSAIISENPTAPSFLATPGYTYYALASIFRNNATADIRPYLQRGRRITTTPVEASFNVGSGTAFAAMTTNIPLGTILPPNVKACSGTVGGSTDEGTTVIGMVMASTASGIGMQHVGSQSVGATLVEGFKRDVGCFNDLIVVDPAAPVLFWRSNVISTKRRTTIWGYTI